MSTSNRKEVLVTGRIVAQGAARSCWLVDAKISSCVCIIFGLYCRYHDPIPSDYASIVQNDNTPLWDNDGVEDLDDSHRRRPL